MAVFIAPKSAAQVYSGVPKQTRSPPAGSRSARDVQRLGTAAKRLDLWSPPAGRVQRNWVIITWPFGWLLPVGVDASGGSRTAETTRALRGETNDAICYVRLQIGLSYHPFL